MMNPTRNGTPLATPLGDPTRLIAFDFYDVPLGGVVQFGDNGPVFQFRLSEQDQHFPASDGVVAYSLVPLPPDAVDRIVGVLSPYSRPSWPIWVPIWSFPSSEVEDAVSASVDLVLSQARGVERQVSINWHDVYEKHNSHAT